NSTSGPVPTMAPALASQRRSATSAPRTIAVSGVIWSQLVIRTTIGLTVIAGIVGSMDAATSAQAGSPVMATSNVQSRNTSGSATPTLVQTASAFCLASGSKSSSVK